MKIVMVEKVTAVAFKVDPDTLYTLDELSEQLVGMVQLPTFLDRLGLRNDRVFRDAVWGWEILDAARHARSFSGAAEGQAAPVVDDLLPGLGARSAARAKGPKSAASRPPIGRLGARDLRK